MKTQADACILDRLAPCGLHCGECFAFTRGEIHKASLKLKEFLGNFEPYAERFVTRLDPIFKNYPVFKEFLDYLAAAECTGCRNEKCKFYKTCKVRPCAQEKEVDFCHQCPEFPCRDSGLDENLYQRHVAINEKIREVGVEAYYDGVKGRSRY